MRIGQRPEKAVLGKTAEGNPCSLATFLPHLHDSFFAALHHFVRYTFSSFSFSLVSYHPRGTSFYSVSDASARFVFVILTFLIVRQSHLQISACPLHSLTVSEPLISFYLLPYVRKHPCRIRRPPTTVLFHQIVI
jgi:hypothetical protein